MLTSSPLEGSRRLLVPWKGLIEIRSEERQPRRIAFAKFSNEKEKHSPALGQAIGYRDGRFVDSRLGVGLLFELSNTASVVFFRY